MYLLLLLPSLVLLVWADWRRGAWEALPSFAEVPWAMQSRFPLKGPRGPEVMENMEHLCFLVMDYVLALGGYPI